MPSHPPFLWAVFILLPFLLSVSLWATFPPELVWPQRVALSGGCLVLYTLCTCIRGRRALCALAAGPFPCPHNCSYYNTAPGFSYSSLCCLKDGQLYGKALGTGFVGMYGPTQCLGRAGQWISWPQEGKKIKKKKRDCKNKSRNTY
jgi:hypothetical protein